MFLCDTYNKFNYYKKCRKFRRTTIYNYVNRVRFYVLYSKKTWKTCDKEESQSYIGDFSKKTLVFFSTAKGHVCFISVKCKNVKYVLLQEYSCNTTVLYKLSYTNRRAGLNCDNCFNPGKTEPILLLFNGQSLFPYINFLNNVFLFLTHEALLHGVWCAMSVIRSIGRCFVRR